MKNLILKTNEYYDSLPEMKRLLFFLIVIGGSLLMALLFMYFYDFIWAFIIWAVTVSFWRCSYTLFNWNEWYKKTHTKIK